MVILFITLLLICLYGIKFNRLHSDYLSKDSTNAIKGIFAVIILFSHMRGYITLGDDWIDQSYIAILYYIGQLMVAMYLFYSGYGIMESLRNKPSYMKTFPRKRILKILIHFDIAVLVFAVIMTMLGTFYPWQNYLLCWTGWEDVGNSNWFIFDILILYCIVYVVYAVSPNLLKDCKIQIGGGKIAILTSVLAVAFWLFMRIFKGGSWWYDTIMTFPLGLWFSIYKQQFETVMKTKWSPVIFIAVIATFVIWHARFGNDQFGFSACIFCLMLVVLSTKIKLDNKILQWLGTNAFSIYIIQRIPMNIYEHFGINEQPYLFAVITIPSVLLTAWAYNKLLNHVDYKFFK